MASGDIGAVLDTLLYDDGIGDMPSIIHVSGDIYAVAYKGRATAENDGYIRTFTIDSEGGIGAAVIDTLEFDTGNCNYPHIVHISGDYYAIAYTGADDDGWLCTVTIDSAGEIGNSVVDTLEFEAGTCYNPRIVHLSGNYYAIVYQGPDSDGWIVTVQISTVGVIPAAIEDSYEFDGTRGQYPDIIKVVGTVYLIAYTGEAGSDGWLKTLTIGNTGVIAASPDIDTLEFDTTGATDKRIIHIAGDFFAVAYCGGSAAAVNVVTVEVDPAGNIAAAITDSLVIDAYGNANEGVSIAHIAGETYVVAYGRQDGADKDGYIAGFTITNEGVISNSIVDSLEFDGTDIEFPVVLRVSSKVVAIVYDSIPYGTVKTVSVTAGEVFPTDPLLRASGIRRTFWAGLGGRAVYQCELALGGISTSYVSPIGSREIPSAVTPTTDPLRDYINRKPSITETGIPGVTMPFTTTAPTAPQMAEYAGMGKTEYNKIIQQGKVTRALREFGPITGPADLERFKAQYPQLGIG